MLKLGTYIGHVNTHSMKRPLCKNCREKPRAYAYRKDKKIYWRSECDACIRKKNKLKTGYAPKWFQAGYRVKKHVVKCVDSVPAIPYKWMYIMWMANETMCPLII